MSQKSVLRAACAVACLVAAGTSQAASFSATLGEFTGGGVIGTPLTIGTFDLGIPVGQTVISATISGFFGNSDGPDTAAQEIFADGIKVATCVYDAACWNNEGAPIPWTYTFTGAQLGIFADGKVVLTDVQTDCCYIQIGATTLSGQTVAAVPEPETYALMLAGLGAVAWVARRRAA